MTTIILRTNLDAGSPILIADLGFPLPAGGSPTQTFTDEADIADIRGSQSLRALAVDGAFPFGAETSADSVILSDGVNELPPGEVDTFLSAPTGSQVTTLVRPFTAGVGVRDAVFQKSDGTVDRAVASAIGTGIPIGIVEAINTPTTGECVVRFAGDLGGFTGLVAGSIYLLSTALGGIVEETDTGNGDYPDTSGGSGHVMIEVGIAASATVLYVGTNRDFQTF